VLPGSNEFFVLPALHPPKGHGIEPTLDEAIYRARNIATAKKWTLSKPK